jgi:hypothetical protein
MPSLLDLDRLPPADWPPALRAAFRRWLAAPSHAELADLTAERDGVRARCDPRQPTLRPAALGAENAAARGFVAGLVTRAPVGGWIALDAFVDLVWHLDPFFLRGRQRVFAQPAWWLEDGADGRPLDAAARDEWRRGEGRYLRALATGPLHWWGAVDLAEDAAGEPRAMRLTPFGAYLLDAGPAPEGAIGALAAGWGAAALPAGPGRLAVQPLAAGPELLGALAPWARFTAVRGGRLIAQLSADLACAGFDAGREPSGLLDRLRASDARDRTRAADALAPVLDGWRARHGAARMERGLALLEGRDAAVLREALAAAPALAARGRLVASHLAAVPAADADEWERALRRRGFIV